MSSSNANLSSEVAELKTRVAALEARLTTMAAASTTTKKAAKKAAKNPDAPKRAPSSYIRFSVAKRAEVVAANPTAKMGDIAKIIGGMWKLLSDDEKASYKVAVAPVEEAAAAEAPVAAAAAATKKSSKKG
jgi:hypothetical protein